MIERVIDKFSTISLLELKKVSLLRRFDTKYFFNFSKLEDVLIDMQKNYQILKIKNNLKHQYSTYYYDDKNKSSYIKHHNGKKNREKLRFRNYIESGECYLEIKTKNNKGQTNKKRIKTTKELKLTDLQKNFILNNSNFDPEKMFLENTNSFARYTFTDKKFSHRITIDTDFVFNYKKEKIDIPRLVILELKESKGEPISLIKEILKKHNIKKNRISKYCLTTFMLNNKVKANNFKRLMLTLEKFNIIHY